MSPLKAALWALAPTVFIGGAAPLATALARQVDRAYVIGNAFVLTASEYGVLTQMHPNSSLAIMLTGSGLLTTNLIIMISLVTKTIVGSVTPNRASTASTIIKTYSEFDNALDIAILNSINTTTYQTNLPTNITDP